MASLTKDMSKLESQLKSQEGLLDQDRPKYIKAQEEVKHVLSRQTKAETELKNLTEVPNLSFSSLASPALCCLYLTGSMARTRAAREGGQGPADRARVCGARLGEV
eukprot:m.843930 g.843930  ORF g.843930 m.843930 type:complete len:106 (+) comp59540_c0_seq5:113-430(+)